jgi:drug/metabolite transporter (DMT)-like permease
MVSVPGVRLRADLTLLLVAVIWGSAFVAQRVAAINAGVFLFNGLRFLLGALVLLPFARGSLQSLEARALSGVFLAGTVLFGGTAFQQWGIRYTTAANAGFSPACMWC